MPNCQFVTTQVGEQFRHACPICKTVRISASQRYVRECLPPSPTLAAKAVSFVRWSAAWARRGFRRPDKDQYQQRLEICQACPLFNQAEKRCGSCGCYVPWKAAGLSANGKSDCPEGKWPIIQ